MYIHTNVYIHKCTLYCMSESPILEKRTHSPNLDTIQMIEKTIEDKHDFRTITELYHSLPRGVQYATFKKVLVYLEESNKISYDADGVIFWIFARNKSGLVVLEKESTQLR